MSAKTNVGAVPAAAMTPELAELERQLGEALEAMKVVDRELPAWAERTDRAINRGRALGCDDTMAAADARVAELQATKQALIKTAAGEDFRDQAGLR